MTPSLFFSISLSLLSHRKEREREIFCVCVYCFLSDFAILSSLEHLKANKPIKSAVALNTNEFQPHIIDDEEKSPLTHPE